MTDHPELENSVAAFVLGAADEDEMEAVRAHLGGCAECRQLAGRLQRAADALPLATEIVDPPARLKARILAAAATTARTPVRPPSRARILALPRPRSLSGWSWPRPPATLPMAAAAALVLAVLGLGAWNLHLVDQLGHQQVASVTLSGQGQLSGAQATVVDFREQSVALVTFSRLPAPPPGKVYELWLIPASGAPEAVTVFQPDGDGSKTVVVNRDLRRYKIIAVTAEDGPAGVAAPTQQPSLAGNVV